MTTTEIEPQAAVFVEIHDSTNVVGVSVPELSFVEVVTVVEPVQVEVIPPSAYLEVIDNAIRGPAGPTGPTGPAGSGSDVVTFPTGDEPSLDGVPDGTLWVEYTP